MFVSKPQESRIENHVSSSAQYTYDVSRILPTQKQCRPHVYRRSWWMSKNWCHLLQILCTKQKKHHGSGKPWMTIFLYKQMVFRFHNYFKRGVCSPLILLKPGCTSIFGSSVDFPAAEGPNLESSHHVGEDPTRLSGIRNSKMNFFI